MKPYLLLILLLVSHAADAQTILGKSREEIEKKLQERYSKDSLYSTDSTISHSPFPDNQSFLKYTYHFSPAGKFRWLTVASSSDSLFRATRDRVLSEKKYRWKKINGNQYVSKYSKKLLFETDPDIKKNSFKIIRTSWKRKTYRLLEF